LGQHSFVACNPVSMHCFNAITNYWQPLFTTTTSTMHVKHSWQFSQ
jgi:hypothetical protein